MAPLLVIEDVKAISVADVTSIGVKPCYYTNLVITGKDGVVIEITLSSKDKAVLDQLKSGV